MAHNPVSEIASTIQAAHINRNPDPRYDLNPSSAASGKIPVRFSGNVEDFSIDAFSSTINDDGSADVDEIPVSVLEPVPRRANLPPLPDLRFEQSYLARIKDASTWQAVAWITFLDHVIMPLSQGMLWNLMLFGWRHWNAAAKFQGAGVGAKVRRWWWGVNNWSMPGDVHVGTRKR